MEVRHAAPRGARDDPLMKFCSLLRHKRYIGYARIGFCVPLRPWVRAGFETASRCGSTGPRSATGAPSRTLRSFPLHRATPNFYICMRPTTGLHPLQGSPSIRCHGLSPATVSPRVLCPFDRSSASGSVRAAMLELRRLQGLISLVAPSSPPIASPAYFIRVRPWGFPLQGLFLLPDCVCLATLAHPHVIDPVCVETRT